MHLKNLIILALTALLFSWSQAVMGQRPIDNLGQSSTTTAEFSDKQFSIEGIYPNPVIDHLVIKGEVDELCQQNRCLYAIIVDSDGTQYYEERLDLSNGEHEIQLIDWPSQYYFLMIFTSEGRLRYDAVFLKRN